jgi:hypothetical protein
MKLVGLVAAICTGLTRIDIVDTHQKTPSASLALLLSMWMRAQNTQVKPEDQPALYST